MSSSRKVKVKVMLDSLWPHELYSTWNSAGQNTGEGSLSLLQGIFPNQGTNPGFPHSRQILYQLSHKWSPRILEWITCPFSSVSPWPRNWTRVSCIANGFFFLPTELSWKPCPLHWQVYSQPLGHPGNPFLTSSGSFLTFITSKCPCY